MTAMDRTRDADVLQWLDSLLQDLRHAVRSLRRAPALVGVSVLSLGLGVGLNLSLYSTVREIFLRTPTMAEPSRVVGVESGNNRQWSYPNYRDLRDAGIFKDTMAFRTSSMSWRTSDDYRRLSLLVVSANFFDGLGARAQLGRTFTAAEAAPERAPRQLVLTYSCWVGRFGADPLVLGTAITLNGERFEIVGVLPEGFRSLTGFMSPEAYVPISALSLTTIDDRGSASLDVVGRLKDGAAPEQAQAAVTALAQQLERQDPEKNEGLGAPAEVFPARSLQFRGTPAGFTLLPILLSVVFGLVLLIGTGNVAGLLLARAMSRRHELSIRAALGAGRARVVQSLLVESLVLAMLGAGAGVLLVYVLSTAPLPGVIGGMQQFFTPDWRLIGPSLVLILATTLLCGLVPALRATRGNIVPALRLEEATIAGRSRLRSAVVVVQVAISLVLLVIATLCFRGQMRAFNADVGFDLDHGIVARFTLEPSRDSDASRRLLAERVTERVQQLPGVRSAAATALVPLGGDAIAASFHPAGRSDVPGVRPTTVSVGPRYFETLDIPILRGREFWPLDRAGSPPVAIVNQTFARTYFGDADPLGGQVSIGGEQPAVVVGVARDSKLDTIGEAAKSAIYYPYAQRTRRLTVVVRTTGAPGAAVQTVRRAIAEVDPTINVGVSTLREAASQELEMRRTGTMLVGTIGAVGLLLAAIGLYGIVSYLVAAGRFELGIRMALGASPGQLRRSVVRHALGLVLLGVLLGGAASMLVTPALATFLAGLSPLDPVAYGTGMLILLLAGFVASYLPSRRVTRVDPVMVLRRY